jgi:hypothetical protein
VRRRAGEPVDVMATVFRFETIDAFVGHVAETYQVATDAQQMVDQRQRDLLAEKETALVGVPLYAPYGRTAKDLAGSVRRGDTHELIDPSIRLVTFEELYRRYFCHPNSTAADPHGIDDCGVLHVHAQSIIVIGKESHPIRNDGTDVEGGREERAHIYGAVDLSARMRRFPLSTWVKLLSGVSRREVERLYRGERGPSDTTRVQIAAALATLESGPTMPSWDEIVRRLRGVSVREVHAATGLSERTLRSYRSGERRAKGNHLTALLDGLERIEVGLDGSERP